MDAPSGVTRPIVFFDVQIGETPAGRIKMELFSDIVPKSVLLDLPGSLLSLGGMLII